MIAFTRRYQRKYLPKYSRSWRQILEIHRLWILLLRKFLSAYLVCDTEARRTTRRRNKFVDIVGWAVLHINADCVFATWRTVTKADHPFNFTIFHCRMSTIQPAWPVGTTPVCWHACCWHFCSCSSHKTIPSWRELGVTQLWTDRCCVTYLSIGITQVFIMIARIS